MKLTSGNAKRFGQALAAAAVASTMLLTGCGLGAPDTVVSAAPGSTPSTRPADEAPAPTPTPTSSGTLVPTPTSSGTLVLTGLDVAPQDAATTALEAHPDGRILEIELDRWRGSTVWSVTLITADGKREVYVDGVTGAVLADEADDSDDLVRYRRMLDRAEFHPRLIERLLEAQPGGIVKIELEDDDGSLFWEVEIITANHRRIKLHIDPDSGQVVRRYLDDDDDE
ncbi:Uncharacterized membrane protein YkoI [Tessaracoccus bendigoensis DSM 12906]|uniref:Uncharacterized membrane protein YkoI n=1 Tax=Tessaracoccus bendigoensis DSM 12906 TaxID=1123357 RepID=A0A1M6E239_9ACTN|nr:PepSY domain-containing protein [Tessaracoccus bendigoensis]SHI79469.1 Uncharacterized membrane protein YkoI [Tessaracoccus bendigoensis DSM 12906]